MKRASRGAKSACLILLTISICVAGAGATEEVAVDFQSDRWEIQGGGMTRYLDRDCFAGRAVLKDVEFENGVIEVDMAFEGARSFVGFLFRMESDLDFENVYLRPHKNNLPDGLQYTPVFHGDAGWQLYNGPGFTAQAPLPAGRWMNVRLEVSGTQARVFLDGRPAPALVVNELKRGLSSGWIGVSGPAGGLGYFANFRYRLDEGLELPPVEEAEEAVGMITGWELSKSLAVTDADFESHPGGQGLGDLGWRKVPAEATGLVNVSRSTARSGPGQQLVFARATLHSDRAEVRELRLGYSDSVVVFLNQQAVFSGVNSYRSRDGNYLGAVGLFDSIYVPLEAGENELMLALIDAFGGWGFICQDGSHQFQDPAMRELWQIRSRFNLPESVVYDAERELLYVTNFGIGQPRAQFISRVTLDGKIDELRWVTGLDRPLGMVLVGDALFVVERNALVEIDVEQAEVACRYQLPGAVFPNDIAADFAGNLYISDSNRNVLYRFADEEVLVWLSGAEVSAPNGMLIDGQALIFGNNGDHSLKRVDLATQAVETVVRLGPGIIDGIEPDGRGNYLVSHFGGRLYRITPTGEVTTLLDTRARGVKLANFEYVQESGLLVIPTLTNNRLLGFMLEESSVRAN